MAEIGDRVGPFALTGRLETDGGLELWEGVRADERLKDPREVWVRLLAVEDAGQARRLRREYEALRAIEDPRVPSVVGFFAGQGALATTRHVGVPLDWALRAATDGLITLDRATALDLTLEVAHALRSAHSILGNARIVHGALVPRAVRIGPKGAVTLMGLGAGLDCPPNALAPECVDGAEPTRLSDQWQLGAFLFELLTLRPLVLPLPISGLREDPGRQLESLDPADARLLRRLVAPSPEDRFHKQRELLQALHQRAREVGGTSGRVKLYERILAVRERLEDPTDIPELGLAADEVSVGDREISVSEAMQATLDVPLDVMPDDAPLLGASADAPVPEDRSLQPTEPLPSVAEPEPEEPSVPPVRTVGEWTALLLALLFLVSILWWVTARVM